MVSCAPPAVGRSAPTMGRRGEFAVGQSRSTAPVTIAVTATPPQIAAAELRNSILSLRAATLACESSEVAAARRDFGESAKPTAATDALPPSPSAITLVGRRQPPLAEP